MDEPAKPSDDAGAPWYLGRFFPNDCRGSNGRWDNVGDAPSLNVRHLPTTRDIVDATLRFGPRAEPMLTAWRALWDTALRDVDEAVREIGLDCDRLELPGDRYDRLMGHAESYLKAKAPAQAARSAYQALDGAANPLHRATAFHVLEEAATHLALASTGLPFSLRVVDGKRRQRFFEPDGAGGLAAVEQHSAAHTMAHKRLALCGTCENPYWGVKAFRAAAGRPMAVALGYEHLAMVLLDMAAQGHAKAFLKSCRSKVGTWVVDISGLGAPGEVRDRIRAAMGDGYVDLFAKEDMRRSILIQSFTPFTHEHRFLLVNHRVVSSSASDRGLCVLDGNPNRILHGTVARLRDPAEAVGAYDRGDSDAQEARPLVAAMALGARALARDIKKEFGSGNDGWCDRPDAYCIDMGVTADGRILPIEMNTVLFCGLYAADYGRVARAFERRLAVRSCKRARTQGKAYEALRAHGDAATGLPAWEAPGLPLSADDVTRIRLAYVADVARGRRPETAVGFAKTHRKAIAAHLAMTRPGLTAFERMRETAYFEVWLEPGWEDAWSAWVEKDADKRFSQVSHAIACCMESGGRYTVSTSLYGGMDDIAAVLRAPCDLDWRSQKVFPSKAGLEGGYVVDASVPWYEVDWPTTILGHVMSDRDESWPVTLLPAARPMISRVRCHDPDRGVITVRDSGLEGVVLQSGMPEPADA